MKRSALKSILMVFGLALSFSAYGQGGFGGGQDGGGFGGGGGGGFGGGGGGGFGGGDAGGGFGGDTGAQGQQQEEVPIEGNWQLEFEVEFDSQNADIERDRIRVRADVTQTGQELTGRLRGDGEGTFTCTMIQGTDYCENGEILIIWEDETERRRGTFEFTVDRMDSRRAKGEAIFTDNENGHVIQYDIDMRKR